MSVIIQQLIFESIACVFDEAINGDRYEKEVEKEKALENGEDD
jgi:hypothetical protein